MAHTGFTVCALGVAGATVLRVSGEVDAATAPALRDAIAGAAPPGVLVVDLLAVTFLASAGLGVLADAADRTEVRVVATGRECVRPIVVTGLAAVLSVHATLADALA